MKKTFTILLSVMLFCITTINVNATQLESAKVTAVSETALMSVRASAVPESAIEVLEKNGAVIDNDTLIEVLRVNDTEDTAVCVTNINDGILEKDIYISYVEDEENNLVIDNSFAEALAQGYDYDMSASFPPLSWNGDYIVHATASAEIFSDGIFTYYKPYGCEFYYENYAGVSISSIEVEYICDGFLYSYPGFDYLDLDEYVHVVSVYKSNPVAGTVYRNTNSFPYSDKVLSVSAGSPFVGNFITFSTYVNGELETYTVTL